MNKLYWILLIQISWLNVATANMMFYEDQLVPKRFDIKFDTFHSQLVLTQYSGRFFPKIHRTIFPLRGTRQIPVVYQLLQEKLGQDWDQVITEQMLWNLEFDRSGVQEKFSIKLAEPDRRPSSKNQELALGQFRNEYHLSLVLDEAEQPIEFILTTNKGDFTDFSVKMSDGYYSLISHRNEHILTVQKIKNVRKDFIVFDLVIPIDGNQLNQVELKRLHLMKLNDQYVMDSNRHDIAISKNNEVESFLDQYKHLDQVSLRDIETQFRNCLVYQNYSSLSQFKSGLDRNCVQEAELEMKFKTIMTNLNQYSIARQCLIDSNIGQLINLPFGSVYFARAGSIFDAQVIKGCQHMLLSNLIDRYQVSLKSKLEELHYKSHEYFSFNQLRADLYDCLMQDSECPKKLMTQMQKILVDFLNHNPERFDLDKRALLANCLKSSNDLDQTLEHQLRNCHLNVERLPHLGHLTQSLLGQLDFLSSDESQRRKLIQQALSTQVILGWSNHDRFEDLVLARIAVWKHYEVVHLVSQNDHHRALEINNQWLFSITKDSASQVDLYQAYYQIINSRLPGQTSQEQLLKYILRIIPPEFQVMSFFSSCMNEKKDVVSCWLKQTAVILLDQFQLEMEEMISKNLSIGPSKAHDILRPLSHAHFCIMNQSTKEPDLYFARVSGCLFLTGFDISLNIFNDQFDQRTTLIQCLSKNKHEDFQKIVNSPLLINEKIDLITLANSLLPQRLLRHPEMSELRSTLVASLPHLGAQGKWGECLKQKRF